MKTWVLGCALAALAACTEVGGGTGGSNGYIGTLPEAVVALAAPGQDLKSVRLDPEDGCYVYRYAGPVETTFLPLRSKDGRPICTQAPDAPKKT